MIYYKSCPIVVIPYAYSWYKYLINKKTRKRYLFFSIIFGSCLIISGTRANMLSGIMLPLIILLYYFLKIKKNILGFYLILMSSAIFFMYIIAKILTDLNESSFVIKSGHLYSYIKLFSENPIQMIIGYGPGSMFYSSGNGLMVSETELTYFEILRRYGLIGAFLILWIFFCPIIFMYQKIKNNKEYFPFFMGYITYLFIGGTNPLLFSSTGIIVLIQNYMFCDENNMKMAQNVLN
jgi:O-antigen ligase